MTDERPGTPRWVKVTAAIAVVVVALVAVMLLVGGGDHGPGRHGGSGNNSGDAQPSSIPEQHQPPEGGHQAP